MATVFPMMNPISLRNLKLAAHEDDVQQASPMALTTRLGPAQIAPSLSFSRGKSPLRLQQMTFRGNAALTWIKAPIWPVN
jgi:hypothetical protein